jgi:hypothetical protein
MAACVINIEEDDLKTIMANVRLHPTLFPTRSWLPS